MKKIHLEIYQNDLNAWHSAATLSQHGQNEFELEYELDYAIENLGRRDEKSLSISYPVQIQKYKGDLPGFIVDLIPQGDPLKRMLSRYGIANERDIFAILSQVPLAPPGNIRVAEPWVEIDGLRDDYEHRGFSLEDILNHKEEFVAYMEASGAPVGGTSGVAGGSPKFLLRKDQKGRFHADGLLPNFKTKSALLVKFPYTDSKNSTELSHLEKKYYDLIQDLSLYSGPPMEIHDNILFINRFDRSFETDKTNYYGLESLYSAHNINVHGARLLHESNLELIARTVIDPSHDIMEYMKRDVLNRALSNTDNHGRNTSFLKDGRKIKLSPLYDVTAMRFFKSEIISELTRWKDENAEMRAQVNWVVSTLGIERDFMMEEFRAFYNSIKNLAERMKIAGISDDWIERTSDDRNHALSVLGKLFT